MEEKDSNQIAEAWLNFQRNWWAWDKLDELCRKDAQGAWAVLIDLVDLADSKELLEDIGVGPLEDFINYYAADCISEIEIAATSSEALSQALSYAQLRDSVATRVMSTSLSVAGKLVNIEARPRYQALLKRVNLDDASLAEWERTIEF